MDSKQVTMQITAAPPRTQQSVEIPLVRLGDPQHPTQQHGAYTGS